MPQHLDALIRDVARGRGHGGQANLVVLLGPQHHVVLNVGGQALAVAVDLAAVAARDVVARLLALAHEADALAAPVVQRQHVGQAGRDDADGRLHGEPHAHGRQRPRVVVGVVEEDEVVDSHQARYANTITQGGIEWFLMSAVVTPHDIYDIYDEYIYIYIYVQAWKVSLSMPNTQHTVEQTQHNTTYKIPSNKLAITIIFFRAVICSFKIRGIGIASRKKSRKTLTLATPMNMLPMWMHWPVEWSSYRTQKYEIGRQAVSKMITDAMQMAVPTAAVE